MNNVKFYILVHDRPDRLDRRLKYYTDHKSPDNFHVVINSNNQLLINTIIKVCNNHDVCYNVTESDGTAATGKNSMLETFVGHRNVEYAVCIDGDDIVTPWGLDFYLGVGNEDKAPDLLVLYKQISIKSVDENLLHRDSYYEDLPKKWDPRYVLSLGSDGRDVAKFSKGQMAQFIMMQCPVVDYNTITKWTNERHKFHHYMNSYSEDYEYMTRMVFWSKKAAKLAHYNKDLVIGEDTEQFLRIKYEASKGNLRVYRKMDGRRYRPTYLAVDGEPSVTRTKEQTSWDWCEKLNRCIEKLSREGKLPPKNLDLPDWEKNI
jgi:hypothetical protein